MKQKKTVPFSLRLSPELTARLEECAGRLRLKKHSLAQAAIEAAIEAIEANGYRLVVPIEFKVGQVPAPAPGAPYPQTRHEVALVEDRPVDRVGPKGKTGTPK